MRPLQLNRPRLPGIDKPVCKSYDRHDGVEQEIGPGIDDQEFFLQAHQHQMVNDACDCRIENNASPEKVA